METKYHKKEIATEQLKTAITLFLSNKDLSSVITLAGASANILYQLVRNSGQEPFLDYACRVHNFLQGSTPAREKYNHHIEKNLGISFHKHMSASCPATATLDLEQCAIDALTRAIADYITLYGQNEDLIKKFLHWFWLQKNGPKLMEIFKDMPKKFSKEKKMSKKTYKRFNLAANQLETAIMLFITGGDRFSVITLAGAADVIFSEFVIRNGEENFTDSLIKKNNKHRTRQQIGREINDTLGINACKHLDAGEEEYVLLDIDESALGAILKAIVNYNKLNGKK
ncbi:hypothetical protein [Legionella feeleii]|uniref:Uncharacterized protein n=1 Tax=Legionella feeleii TaxID=453 RepID=A0A378IZL6_9GAMM|nr:hypothetical protein [Legionella feeleii]STX37484.1 Uncharacterised protein [Legionella feeleii]